MDKASFQASFKRFQDRVQAYSGRPFTSFDEGLAAGWEAYKIRLREIALTRLAAEDWTEASIGSGAIVAKVIAATEIVDKRRNTINNLVLWDERRGPGTSEHRVLVDAEGNTKLRRPVERLLWELYRGGSDPGEVFEEFSALPGATYPLLGYLWFLRDETQFMPIRPTTFDAAFADLGIDLVTRSRKSWDNYRQYNDAIQSVAVALRDIAGLRDVRLIDAHSFCWMLERLPKEGVAIKRSLDGITLGNEDVAIDRMFRTVWDTVRNSNGQQVLTTVKNKELRFSQVDFEKHVRSLIRDQQSRCALTGLPLDMSKQPLDPNMKPSLDRIDSNGHYEDGNLQVVCQFVNFWKRDSVDSEFRRLLAIVRQQDLED